MRAARFSAALGARVAIIERRYWGGTCVNVGCIPKKLFSYAAHFSTDFTDSARYGWNLDTPSFDWHTLLQNKNTEIARLNGIYDGMLRNAGCTTIWGSAQIRDPHTIEVSGETISAGNILVAVGGWPRIPDIPGSEHVITSNECFHLAELPRDIVIVGGGYIAVEFAGIFSGLGSAVTQLYRRDLFLRGFDRDVRRHLAQEMRSNGVDLRFDCDISRIERNGDTLKAVLNDGSSLETSTIMYAIGRRPVTDGIGLEEAGVHVNQNGTVNVDDFYRTNVPSILAIGDVLGRVELTPVATAEGMVVARALFGNGSEPVDYRNVPSAVFSQPPIAVVGLTEEQARDEHGDDVEIFRSEFRPLRHSISGNHETTMMKLVVIRSTDRVVGVHMVGPDAAEMLQGFAVALRAGATKAVFDSTIGIHPTSAEEFVTMREPVAH